VHPAHIPLEPKTESAEIRGPDIRGKAVDSSATTITSGKMKFRETASILLNSECGVIKG
jgi:hypothetical protein